MGENDTPHDKLSSWARFLSSLGNLAAKLVWSLIGLLIVAAAGRYLFLSAAPPEDAPVPAVRTVPVRPPIPWDELDAAVVEALQGARAEAQRHASDRLAEWSRDLERRVDEDFLEWYFGYWQQQLMGLHGIAYWTAEKLLDDQPAMAERLTEEIQEEFAKRVLRPRIAQLQLERIAEETIAVWVDAVRDRIAAIPERYAIPRAEWDRYLNDIAVLTADVEANRRVPLTLKTLVAGGAAGGTAAALAVTKAIQPMVAKLGTKITAKAAGKGAGKAAAALAAKTGGKVGAKFGGKLLGAVAGVAIIVWDVWDHYQTKKVERPVLRRNLMDYVAELRESLLFEPETGIMSIVDRLESTIVDSLSAGTAEGHVGGSAVSASTSH